MTLNRRELLRSSLAAGSAALVGNNWLSRAAAAEEAEQARIAARADACILLWLPGGLAQTETFDMKDFTPFEKGMEARACKSTFRSIPTSADGVRISEGLPKLAQQMHHGAILRSVTSAANFGAVHLRAQYYAMTGYLFPAGVEAPSLGSFVSRTLGRRHPDIPAYIDIGRDISSNDQEFLFINTYQGPGFLGVNFAPFMIPEPTQGVPTLQALAGFDRARLDRRQKLYRTLLGSSGQKVLASPRAQDFMHVMDQARTMMDSPVVKSLDLETEKSEVFAEYKVGGRFGLGCLLARRLVETGARFVEVEYQYQPFGNFDTHENGHKRMANLMHEIDSPVAQLITDLNQRGLLKRTLVVIMSEFGRMIAHAPKAGTEKLGFEESTTGEGLKFEDESQYGMHGHMSACRSIVMFGGGVKGGIVHGATADEHPMVIVKDPVDISAVHATIYTALGIPPDTHYITESRPFYVTKDGLGKPIDAVLA